MKLLIVDLETTGLDADNDDIIEFAGVLFDVEDRDILAQASCLVPCRKNEAQNVNKISPDLTKKVSKRCLMLTKSLFESMIEECDYIVCHNAEFDKSFAAWYFKSCDKKPWLCSLEDFDWGEYRIGKLVNLAVDFGVPVVTTHRALADCLLLVEVFKKVEDLEKMIAEAAAPKNVYVAKVSYDNRNLAKELGFVWDRIVPGKWAKRLLDEKARSLHKNGAFRLERVRDPRASS